MSKRVKGMTKKQASRIIEDEIGRYNDAKDTTKSVFENFQYLSNKEKSTIESKFAKPKNPSQARYVHCLNKQFNKIIFTRPAVSADEDLGYLPGTLEEKMAPWIRPIYDILYNFLSPNEVTQLVEDKKIEIAPLAYMRGRTFKNTWIIADEMQNSLPTQMKMLLTRLGENSRMVITGDLDQHDRHGEINGLADFLDKFKGNRSNSIVSVEFENDDIQREEVIKEILDIYAGDVPHDYTHYTDSDDSKSDSDDYQI